MKPKYEECKGCLALDEDGCINKLDIDMPEDYPCPCLNCIVKVICEDECQKFIDYKRKYGIYQGGYVDAYRENKREGM